jgi:hypothetical protein
MSKFISLEIPNVDKALISDYLYHATSAGIGLQSTTPELKTQGLARQLVSPVD